MYERWRRHSFPFLFFIIIYFFFSFHENVELQVCGQTILLFWLLEKWLRFAFIQML